MIKPAFGYIRSAIVPIVHGCECDAALAAARALADDVILIGVLYVPPDKPLSAGALQARQVRRKLRELSDGPHVRYKTQVQVSHTPWRDLVDAIAAEEPDLLVLDWPCQLEALHVSASDVLTNPPCDVALARGPFPTQMSRVLLPMRGGPHAELARAYARAIVEEA